MAKKAEILKIAEPIDNFAEVPEEVLDAEDLKEIAEMKKEPEVKKKPWERNNNPSPESWEPKTKLGEEVKSGKIKNIDEILKSGRKILEAGISDYLLPLKSDLISIGQSKGKFGGGKRRAWRQTQRKTEEGNVPTFSAMAIVGDENGHIGYGYGNSMETLPARDKALRKAKLNIIKVQRACSGFDCDCPELHTVPFKVTGKSGSVRITLIPAPQGTGLVVASELKKVLKLAGIKDVYSKSFGKVRTTFNTIKACFDALEKTNPSEEKEK
jgi:small subunit ribosomal protein S5